MSDLFLGIDTSNYKTSAAIVDENGRIVSDKRKLLAVKRGARGLRQQEALFQHTVNLPEILEALFSGREDGSGALKCAAVSSRPRPVDGSYMPVFLSGMAAAGAISSATRIPLYEFSHQEGHIAAIQYYSELKEKNRFVTFHFSGGTTEAILIDREKGVYELVGGSRDISFGQLLDRTGVALGLEFPAGEVMDLIALNGEEEAGAITLPVIRCADGFVNLSGIETRVKNLIEKNLEKKPINKRAEKKTDREDPASDGDSTGPDQGRFDGPGARGEADGSGEAGEDDGFRAALICSLFGEITRAIARMTVKISEKYGIRDFIFAGGVSASGYIRKHLLKAIRKKRRGISVCFGDPALSSDNAVGIALLGMERYRQEQRAGQAARPASAPNRNTEEEDRARRTHGTETGQHITTE